MNLKHQTQPTVNSCVSTCLAMILDVPAEQVIKEFHDPYMAQTREIDEYLHSKNIKCRPLLSVGNTILGDRIYIFSVPSLNMDAMFHQILGYYQGDNFKIADPNQGREGRRYYVPHDKLDLEDNEVHLNSYSFDYEVWYP